MMPGPAAPATEEVAAAAAAEHASAVLATGFGTAPAPHLVGLQAAATRRGARSSTRFAQSQVMATAKRNEAGGGLGVCTGCKHKKAAVHAALATQPAFRQWVHDNEKAGEVAAVAAR